MEVVCNKSDCGDDWYVIERALTFPRRTWVEPIPNILNCFRYMDSARISDADVEGTKAEMLEIARAIKGHGSYGAKRCAVQVDLKENKVFLYSPRNSQEWGEITLEEAYRLADQINDLLGDPEEKGK